MATLSQFPYPNADMMKLKMRFCSIIPWVAQVDKLGEAQAVALADVGYMPSDPQVAFHLARFIEQVRAVPDDPIIVRQNWLRAYDFATDKGALALNDYARTNDPFALIGREQVGVDVTSVIRTPSRSLEQLDSKPIL